jgi:hypothetical protein
MSEAGKAAAREALKMARDLFDDAPFMTDEAIRMTGAEINQKMRDALETVGQQTDRQIRTYGTFSGMEAERTGRGAAQRQIGLLERIAESTQQMAENTGQFTSVYGA